MAYRYRAKSLKKICKAIVYLLIGSVKKRLAA